MTGRTGRIYNGGRNCRIMPISHDFRKERGLWGRHRGDSRQDSLQEPFPCPETPTQQPFLHQSLVDPYLPHGSEEIALETPTEPRAGGSTALIMAIQQKCPPVSRRALPTRAEHL
jgi:hypothetical protein